MARVKAPPLRLHKTSNRAYIFVNHRRVYLGKAGTPEALEKYHTLAAEIMANGGRLPVSAEDITVAEVADHYIEHAAVYYGGPKSSSAYRITGALKPLLKLYRRIPCCPHLFVRVASIERTTSAAYGGWFRRRVESMAIEEVLTVCHSLWQNPYVQPLHGSIRRECTDHVIVFSEDHLRRLLRVYFSYYRDARTHLGLGKETPMGRPTSSRASPTSRLVERPRIGGLHHRYEWNESA